MRPNPFLPPERQRQPSQHQHQLQNQQQSPTPPALDLPRPLPWDLLYATASPRQLPTHSKPSPTHKPYRSTVGGSGAVVTRDSDQEREREEDTGKDRGRETPPPPIHSCSFARSGSLYAPISYTTFRDTDLHTTMQIPTPHAVEGFAPGIPTAGLSSGVNQYGGYSTPRSKPSSVWVCRLYYNHNHNYNCNHCPRILTMGNDTSWTRRSRKRLGRRG